MIYITGDTHGSFERFSKKKMIRKNMCLTDKDYIIVCGDLGLCWAKGKEFEYYCDIFKNRQYSILWVQGNHENYDMIAEYPLEEWHGGKVRHIVRDKVILLERGQIFEIDGKKFFTFGGASSHDIQGGLFERDDPYLKVKIRRANRDGLPFRIKNYTWWEQELPSENEMNEGRMNLSANNYEVDYVITHCCSTKMQNTIIKKIRPNCEADILTDYFDEIEEKLKYKHWFFGHYHRDQELDKKHTLLYEQIVSLDKY